MSSAFVRSYQTFKEVMWFILIPFTFIILLDGLIGLSFYIESYFNKTELPKEQVELYAGPIRLIVE